MNVDADLRHELHSLRQLVANEASATRVEMATIAGQVNTIQATLMGQINLAAHERATLAARVTAVEIGLRTADEDLEAAERERARLWTSYREDRGRVVGFALGLGALGGGVVSGLVQAFGA